MQQRKGVLVGCAVSVREQGPQRSYFTDLHRRWVGKAGRVHAVVPGSSRDNPLVKVGFEGGTHIVFYRLADLVVHRAEPPAPEKHGKRGSHLPNS